MLTNEQINAIETLLNLSYRPNCLQAPERQFHGPLHVIKEESYISGRLYGWQLRTLELLLIGEPYKVNGKWRSDYNAEVELVVHVDGKTIVRRGAGYGFSFAQNLAAAQDGAIKEAQIDALHQALKAIERKRHVQG